MHNSDSELWKVHWFLMNFYEHDFLDLFSLNLWCWLIFASFALQVSFTPNFWLTFKSCREFADAVCTPFLDFQLSFNCHVSTTCWMDTKMMHPSWKVRKSNLLDIFANAIIHGNFRGPPPQCHVSSRKLAAMPLTFFSSLKCMCVCVPLTSHDTNNSLSSPPDVSSLTGTKRFTPKPKRRRSMVRTRGCFFPFFATTIEPRKKKPPTFH